MTNLKQSLKQPLTNAASGLVIAFFVIALLGFADSTYLTIEHFSGAIPPCSIVTGCEAVLTSAYSVILGVPVSLLGALYYVVIAIGAFIFIEARFVSGAVAPRHFRTLKWTLILTTAGLIMTLWFLYVQAFILHSFCLYCLGSAASSTLLFILAVIMLCKNKAGQISSQPTLNEIV